MNSDSTTSNAKDVPLTIDILKEALALIKALAPKEAPGNCLIIKGSSGLNILVNSLLPENTVMVSKRLFDFIYESSQPHHKPE